MNLMHVMALFALFNMHVPFQLANTSPELERPLHRESYQVRAKMCNYKCTYSIVLAHTHTVQHNLSNDESC